MKRQDSIEQRARAKTAVKIFAMMPIESPAKPRTGHCMAYRHKPAIRS